MKKVENVLKSNTRSWLEIDLTRISHKGSTEADSLYKQDYGNRQSERLWARRCGMLPNDGTAGD